MLEGMRYSRFEVVEEGGEEEGGGIIIYHTEEGEEGWEGCIWEEEEEGRG